MDFDAILGGPSEAAPAWLRPAAIRLADAPDPDHARRLAADVLAASDGDALERAASSDPEKLGEILLALCGIAPFFKSYLVRWPAWLIALQEDDLDTPRTAEQLEEHFEQALAGGGDDDAGRILREGKYFELARITVRDASDRFLPLARSAETLDQLSLLADAILARALDVAARRVADSLGPPVWTTQAGESVELSFFALGLGKLGSEELNYSSDVDLVYVHQSPPSDLVLDADRPAPADYFTRLAHGFGRLVSETTSEGFLYRVDLDLRPDDALGAPVISEEALYAYFETRADLWEKAAYMKARPVAGDVARGWRCIRTLAPMIYLSGIDYGAVSAIRALKSKVEDAKGEGPDGFNVKIDRGGIRDIEYVAQALQLMHGARVLQVRDRSTRRALANLAEVGLLPRDHATDLDDAYLFLRRVENRLQMEAERQVHVLPNDRDAHARLARAMGFASDDGAEQFDARLARERETVADLADASVSEDTTERILELFARNAPQLMMAPGTEPLVRSVATSFAHHIGQSHDPSGALNNLDRFIAGLGSRRFYYELLIDRPEIVARLAALFAASKYLSGYFASQPTLIEPVFEDPHTLLWSRGELEADLVALLHVPDDSPLDPIEVQLDGLRRFHHRQMINVGLLDISEEVTRAQAEGSLTEIAEVCLDGALGLARHMLEESARPAPEAAREGGFLVVGMGKLGSGELSYGSDLDVIFLYDTHDEAASGADRLEAQEYFVRLTQRLISNLQTPTAAGTCYEIDARLRPSGNQGTLVTSLAAFRRYHDGESAVWERQALLRARALAGDEALAREFEGLRREILLEPIPDDLAQEIDRIRSRMETEVAKETSARRDFKTGRGGLLDVECAVQYLQLRHGREHEELLAVGRTEEKIDALRAAGLLDADAATTLQGGWDFLQRLGNRLRIVENRSISDLNVERGDLEGLARRMGYDEGAREGAGGRALLRDYHLHTEAIREVYEAILGRAD